MTIRRHARGFFTPIAIALFGIGYPAAMAQGTHAHHHAAEPSLSAVDLLRVELTDSRLTDSDGRQKRLLSDLIGERVSVISFSYLSCTTVCPAQTVVLHSVQEQLAGRLGTKVALLSISIDPGADTPAALVQHMSKIGVAEGWHWLTGDPNTIRRVAASFGLHLGRPEEHSPVVFIGDADHAEWQRINGAHLVPPNKLIEAIDGQAWRRH